MTLRILLFGDSITYGVYDSEGGWATRLVRDYLREEGSDPTVDLPSVYNLGFSGDTTRHLCERITHETNARRSLHDPTEFVHFVAIGINDSILEKDGTPASSPEQYRKDLEDLLAALQKISQQIVFVGITPVIDDNPIKHRYSNNRVWQFETELRDFVSAHDLLFVPLYEQFTQYLQEGKKLLHADGFHPNSAGHEFIYTQVKSKLKAVLTQA